MRRPAMRELAAQLQEDSQHLQKRLAESDWSAAFHLAKDAARAAGQLLQRLQVVLDLEAENS